MADEIVVIVEPPLPDIQVVLSEVSLPGPAGNVLELVGHIDDAVTEHVNDSTPHPAYDDLPSLAILFENGLV